MAGYTVRLGDSADIRLLGGKGANLSTLVTAGLPVPEGLVVTTDAYRAAIQNAGLADAAPDRLRELIPRAEIPEPVAREILDAYERLGSPPVAVRSSGTAEDLAGASFAGAHDTFLNVTGPEAVLAAVRDCWASLWTPRAVSYRERYSWDESDLALAVVIQRMVPAEWAGVMFTADPVSGRRDRIIVEAVRGLGEALVSGEAAGIRCVVDKASRRPMGGRPPIPRRAIRELVRLGSEIESRFGTAQDVEWVYAARRCALVQSRPLTALPDPPESTPPERARRSGMDFSVTADHMPYPPFPMDVSLVFRPALSAVLDAVRSAGFAVPPPRDVVTEIADGVIQIVPPRIRPTWRALAGVPRTVPRVISLLRTDPDAWTALAERNLLSEALRLDSEDLSALDETELLEQTRGLVRELGRLMPGRFGAVMRVMVIGRLAAGLLRLAVGPHRAGALHDDLMADVPCVTTAANASLERIAATVRATDDLRELYLGTEPSEIADRLRGSAPGRALLAEIGEHLARYGFRELAMVTVGQPPLKDVPGVVHGLIAGLARLEPGSRPDAAERLARGRSELASVRGPRARALRPAIARLIDAARAGTAFREDSDYLIVTTLAVARRLLLESGRRLVDRGVLDDVEDVVYLALDELEVPAPQNLRDTVERRRAARAASLDGYTAVPAELLGRRNGDEVVGTPASRGRAVGPVRIIRDETEFGSLGAGEVLVCPYTSPTWTPLFRVACAVVVDSGGAASHAAIVAREYGIPAVMGTGNGTRILSDGQRVLVDADRGTVTPVADRVAPRPREGSGAVAIRPE